MRQLSSVGSSRWRQWVTALVFVGHRGTISVEPDLFWNTVWLRSWRFLPVCDRIKTAAFLSWPHFNAAPSRFFKPCRHQCYIRGDESPRLLLQITALALFLSFLSLVLPPPPEETTSFRLTRTSSSPRRMWRLEVW